MSDPKTLNCEFGGTAGGDGCLSVKLKFAKNQITPSEFDALVCNGVLQGVIRVDERAHSLFPEDAYEIGGTFQVEAFTTDDGRYGCTLRCSRSAIIADDDQYDIGYAYQVWGMWSALAGKSGSVQLARVGAIERRPVGRPPKDEVHDESKPADPTNGDDAESADAA